MDHIKKHQSAHSYSRFLEDSFLRIPVPTKKKKKDCMQISQFQYNFFLQIITLSCDTV